MGAFTSAFSSALNIGGTTVLGIFNAQGEGNGGLTAYNITFAILSGTGEGSGSSIGSNTVLSDFSSQGEGDASSTAYLITPGIFTAQGEGKGTAIGLNVVVSSVAGAGDGEGIVNAFLITPSTFTGDGNGTGAATAYLIVPSAFIGAGEGAGTAILSQIWHGIFTSKGEGVGITAPTNIVMASASSLGENLASFSPFVIVLSSASGEGESQNIFTGTDIHVATFESLIPPDLAQYWGNYLERNIPRFNSRKIFGTYGTIEIRIQWEYPYALPNYLYQAIRNTEEASWWLNYYKNRPDIDGVIFYPAPDQHSTGTFIMPNLNAYVGAPPEDDWMKKVLLSSAYQFGSSGNTF